jgi:multidrug efflux system membrane fusion protein
VLRTAIRTYALPLVALLAAAGCSKKDPPPRQPQVPVRVAVVARGAAPYTLTANGTVEPRQTARVTAQVSGIVTSVDFKEGDNVQKGQVLFRIDQRPYAAALAVAQAALARDQAQAAGARRDAERYQELAKQDYVTKSQAEGQTTTAAALAATVAADRAAIDKARFDLENTVVRAPISGRTGSLLVRQGNVVQASATQPLVVINQITPILVRFTVPAALFPDVQRFNRRGALAVQVTSGGASIAATGAGEGGPTGSGATANSATGNAASGIATDTARGALTFVDNAVDTTTGTVVLKAEFANTDGQLWPGEFVNVTLVLDVQQNQLLVPARAVQTGQQGTYVYVVQPDLTAATRPVTLGRTLGDTVVVQGGLTQGERVVVDGQSRLGAGARVTIASDQPAPLANADTAGTLRNRASRTP